MACLHHHWHRQAPPSWKRMDRDVHSKTLKIENGFRVVTCRFAIGATCMCNSPSLISADIFLHIKSKTQDPHHHSSLQKWFQYIPVLMRSIRHSDVCSENGHHPRSSNLIYRGRGLVPSGSNAKVSCKNPASAVEHVSRKVDASRKRKGQTLKLKDVKWETNTTCMYL